MSRPDRYKALNDELRDCLARCADGQSNAFPRLYELTAPKFSAIIMKMVRDEAECADILQDAYLSIWKSAHRYDPDKGKPFTWMLVITRNRALDKLRKKSRERATQTLSGPIIENIEDGGAGPHENMQRKMLRDMLVPHISKLKPNMSRAVLLSTVEGLSAREIGEQMGVPTNTAKSWIRRGLKRIRKDFEGKASGDQLYKLLT